MSRNLLDQTAALQAASKDSQSTHDPAVQASAVYLIRLLRKAYSHVATSRLDNSAAAQSSGAMEQAKGEQERLIEYLGKIVKCLENAIKEKAWNQKALPQILPRKNNSSVFETGRVINEMVCSEKYSAEDKMSAVTYLLSIAKTAPGFKWNEKDVQWSTNQWYNAESNKLEHVITSPAETLNLICNAILDEKRFVVDHDVQNDREARIYSLFNTALGMSQQEKAEQYETCAAGRQHALLFLLNHAFLDKPHGEQDAKPIILVQKISTYLLSLLSDFLLQALQKLPTEEKTQISFNWVLFQEPGSTAANTTSAETVAPVIKMLRKVYEDTANDDPDFKWQKACKEYFCGELKLYGIDPEKTKMQDYISKDSIESAPPPGREMSMARDILQAQPLKVGGTQPLFQALTEARNAALAAVQKEIAAKTATKERISDFHRAEEIFLEIYEYRYRSLLIGFDAPVFQAKLMDLREALISWFQSHSIPAGFDDIKSRYADKERALKKEAHIDFIENFFIADKSIEDGLKEITPSPSAAAKNAEHESFNPYLSDENIDRWLSENREDFDVLSISSYDVNRILIHALLQDSSEWSSSFRTILSKVTDWILQPPNDAEHSPHAEKALKKSYPKALLMLLNKIAVRSEEYQNYASLYCNFLNLLKRGGSPARYREFADFLKKLIVEQVVLPSEWIKIAFEAKDIYGNDWFYFVGQNHTDEFADLLFKLLEQQQYELLKIAFAAKHSDGVDALFWLGHRCPDKFADLLFELLKLERYDLLKTAFAAKHSGGTDALRRLGEERPNKFVDLLFELLKLERYDLLKTAFAAKHSNGSNALYWLGEKRPDKFAELLFELLKLKQYELLKTAFAAKHSNGSNALYWLGEKDTNKFADFLFKLLEQQKYELLEIALAAKHSGGSNALYWLGEKRPDKFAELLFKLMEDKRYELFKTAFAAKHSGGTNAFYWLANKNINKFADLLFKLLECEPYEPLLHFKEAIRLLTSTLEGRDLLRKKLKIESGKFFFGNVEISAESLQIQVNGKSIHEWLSMSTAMDLAQEEEQKARQAMDVEAQTSFGELKKLFQTRLFKSFKDARGATVAQRIPSDAVNLILQNVVYGDEKAVKAALEAAKSNSTQLFSLLSDTGTAKDYSDRIITGKTLLQTAAAAGDIEMCVMLKDYMLSEEVSNQLTEIFPGGIEAHEEEQKRNTFNFDAILAAIRTAGPDDLDAALNKQDNGSPLCLALEEFRRRFTEISCKEKIFNPQHLLCAYEVYSALYDQCDFDEKIDPSYKKRNLFWRQIIGYTQRFMPACYAQALAQGLYSLMRVDQDASWTPEPFNRALKLKHDDFSYFPLAPDSRSGLGFDFLVAQGCAMSFGVPELVDGQRRLGRIFQKFLSSKNIRLSELYAASVERYLTRGPVR